MDLTQVAKLQEDARSMAKAAQYLGKAANELAPVALPAARDALAKTPQRLATVATRVRSLTPETLRKKQLAVAICAGVAAAGFTAAAIAHVVHHRRAVALYRDAKREVDKAKQDLADRERVLADCTHSCSALEFLSDSKSEDAEGKFSQLSVPGCFAICAYEEEPEQGAFSKYRDVYVGASEDIAAAAAKQLEGKGNLYVHADVVYGQPLRVFFFPSESYEVYARKEGLVRALGAESSYNKVSELSELD